MQNVPQLVWQHAEDTSVELSVGCWSCLHEGVDAPLKRIYFQAGTALCAKHVLAQRNQNG